EHLAHLFFGYRAEATTLAAAAPEVDVPGAACAGSGTWRGPRAGLLVHPPVGAQLVVLLPLGGIAKDLVGLVNLLELGLGRLVAWIDIGMVLARQLPIRLFDFLLRGGFC